MSSTRTIEDYVGDVITMLKQKDYAGIQDTHRTLEKMKSSREKKHRLNYWRVLQCLGEVAIDNIIQHILKLEKKSSKYEVSSNLLVVLALFFDTMYTTAVIKRVIYFNKGLYPILFRCVRQFEYALISSTGFGAIYRIVLVGKGDLVEHYMKYGLLKDIYQHIKRRYETSQFCSDSVGYVYNCTKLLHAVCLYGTENIRRQVKRHPIIFVLSEYAKLVKIDKVIGKHLMAEVTDLNRVLANEEAAQAALLTWKTKERLKEHLEETTDFTFCSSPSCRKMAEECDKFRYCGACRLSRYCSVDCQKYHWKSAGHKEACLKDPGSLLA